MDYLAHCEECDEDFLLPEDIYECPLCGTREGMRDLDNYDPTPYCSGCGAMTKAKCNCGPIADND